VTQTGGTITHEYAGPDLVRPKTILWYIVVVCGAGPLVIGCSICALHLLTRYPELPALGFLTILGGMCAFATGLTCLTVYAWDAKRTGSVTPAQLNRQRSIALGLLLINLPAAIACVAIGSWSASRYRVVVTNAGATTLDSAIVRIDGRAHELGPIRPGARSSKSFSVDDGGSLVFVATRGGRTLQGEGLDYMDGDQFCDFTFDVREDAIVTSQEPRHGF
jgi:hypothetical protein